MELGKNIVKIRKNNNLTQDEFAQKYYVTRQTVSNWEIGKSYPDLETIVKISNDFNISLDILLKEDKKMVKEIDKVVNDTRKYKKILKIIIIFVLLLVISFSIYSILYFNFNKKLTNKFNDIALKYNFKNYEDTYYLDNDNIHCYITQNFPKLFDFNLTYEYDKSMFCSIETGELLKDNNKNISGISSEVDIQFKNDNKILIETFSCEDKNNFSSTVLDSNGKECDYYSKIANIKIENDINTINNINYEEISEKLKVDNELLKQTLIETTNIYNNLYK